MAQNNGLFPMGSEMYGGYQTETEPPSDQQAAMAQPFQGQFQSQLASPDLQMPDNLNAASQVHAQALNSFPQPQIPDVGNMDPVEAQMSDYGTASSSTILANMPLRYPLGSPGGGSPMGGQAGSPYPALAMDGTVVGTHAAHVQSQNHGRYAMPPSSATLLAGDSFNSVEEGYQSAPGSPSYNSQAQYPDDTNVDITPRQVWSNGDEIMAPPPAVNYGMAEDRFDVAQAGGPPYGGLADNPSDLHQRQPHFNQSSSTQAHGSNNSTMNQSMNGHVNPNMRNQHGLMERNSLAAYERNSASFSGAEVWPPQQLVDVAQEPLNSASQGDIASDAAEGSTVRVMGSHQHIDYNTPQDLAPNEREMCERAGLQWGVGGMYDSEDMPHESQGSMHANRTESRTGAEPEAVGPSSGEQFRLLQTRSLFGGHDPFENLTNEDSTWLAKACENMELSSAQASQGDTNTIHLATSTSQGPSGEVGRRSVVVEGTSVSVPSLDRNDSKNGEWESGRPQMTASEFDDEVGSRRTGMPTMSGPGRSSPPGGGQASGSRSTNLVPSGISSPRTLRDGYAICNIGQCQLSWPIKRSLGNHRSACDGEFRLEVDGKIHCQFQTSKNCPYYSLMGAVGFGRVIKHEASCTEAEVGDDGVIFFSCRYCPRKFQTASRKSQHERNFCPNQPR